jgi:hypothetical protein
VIRALRMLLTVTAAAVVVGTGVAVPANAAISGGTALTVQAAEVQRAACPGTPVPPEDAFDYHNGCKMSNTDLTTCPWPENFVVAPDRTIWHVWPGSGGWKEMPNHGLADNTWNCYVNGNGQHQVEVCLSDGRVFYSYLSGGWRRWAQSDSPRVRCTFTMVGAS